MSSPGKSGVSPLMLVVDLEPTPYKFDQWNACSDAGLNFSVVFSKRRQEGRASGHNYVEFPQPRFRYFMPSSNHLWHLVLGFWAFLRHVVSAKTQIVFVMGYSTLFTVLTIGISKTLGKKVLIHTDSLEQRALSDWGLEPGNALLALSKLRKVLVHRACDGYAVADLESPASPLESSFRGKLVIPFPYAISSERFTESAEVGLVSYGEFCPYILFSGRLIPRKGLETLLVAFSKIQNKDLHLIVEGDGPMLKPSQALARDLGIDGRVIFVGFQQMSLHSKTVLNSDLICVPSLFDSWGLVVVEGMLNGRIVVASDRVGSARSLISDGTHGFLFGAGDSEELKKKIEEALSCSEQVRRRIGSMASAATWAITPSTNAKRLIECQQYLLS